MRVDSGVEAGSEVTPMYDPMFAKLIVWDLDREKATARMLRALGEYEIGGITTLIPFHQAILATKQWANGETCRDLTEDQKWLKSLAPETAPAPAGDDEDSADGKAERSYQVEVGGKLFDVKVIGEAAPAAAAPAGAGPPQATEAGAIRRRRRRGGSGDDLVAPLQGNVFKVPVEEGQEVSDRGPDLRDRGDEDGERDHRPQGRARSPSCRSKEGAAVNAGDLLAKIE